MSKNTLTVTFHKKGSKKSHQIKVASLEEARAEFLAWIKRNHLSADQLGTRAGDVYKDGIRFADISHDGRIWYADGTEIPAPAPAPFEPLKLYPLSKLPKQKMFEFTLFKKGNNATHALIGLTSGGESFVTDEKGNLLPLNDFTSWTPTHLEGHECTSGSAWLSEFGEEYQPPIEVRALVAGGALTDMSWHNDVAPSFKIGVSAFTLWCDAEDVSQREHTEWNRFWISEEDTEGNIIDNGSEFETDDVKEALAKIIDILVTTLD